MLSGSGGLGGGIWQFWLSSHAGNAKYLQLELLDSAHSSSPRLWGDRGGYQASSLLLPHRPLPILTQRLLLDLRLLLGLLVPASCLARLRVLVLRGERAGGQEGRGRLILSVWRPGLPQVEILEGRGCCTYTICLPGVWSIPVVGGLVSSRRGQGELLLGVRV